MVLSKDEFHRMGVPAGVGIPTDEPTPEELKEEELQNMHDNAMLDNLAINQGDSDYIQRMAPGEKARIVQFINTNYPRKTKLHKNELTGELEVKVVEGEIPEELFHAFYGWLAHNASMSNLTEDQLRVEEMNLEIQEMEVMMALPRSRYDPNMNSDLRNAVHLGKLRLFQNKEGTERYLASAEISEDFKAFRMIKDKAKRTIGNVMNQVRGRQE